MNKKHLITMVALACVVSHAQSAPRVTRLTPPSALFSANDPNPPIIARFLPDQRFDIQATIRPDAGQAITYVQFFVDDTPVGGTVELKPATGSAAGHTIATVRAYAN